MMYVYPDIQLALDRCQQTGFTALQTLPASGESAGNPRIMPHRAPVSTLWPVQPALHGNLLNHMVSIEFNSLRFSGGRPSRNRVCP